MKVHYPKLYNMAHLLALNVLLLPKDLTIIFIQIVNLAMFTWKRLLCVLEKHVKCSLTEPMYVYTCTSMLKVT